MGQGKDVQPRKRKAAGPTEQATRSKMHAKAAGDKQKKAVEAAAALHNPLGGGSSNVPGESLGWQ